MNREIYAIIDNVAKDVSGQLIVVRNVNEAIRWFGDLISNPNTTVGAHPTDHDLRMVGTLIITDGVMDFATANTLIITGERLAQDLEQKHA